MQKIHFFEPQCTGVWHAEVNATILEAAIQGLEAEFTLHAESTHLQAILAILTQPDAIRYRMPIDLPAEGASRLFRVAIDAWNTFRVLRSGSKNIVFLSCNSLTLFFVHLVRPRSAKVFVVLHGLLESLRLAESIGVIRRCFGLKNQLRYLNRGGCTYVVIGEHIRRNLLSAIPDLGGSVFALRYSYGMPPMANTLIMRDTDSALRLGSAGVGHRSKGTAQVLELSYKLKNLPRIEFHYIGQLKDSSLEVTDFDHFHTRPALGPISVSRYNELFSSLDFLILLYPKAAYTFGISGVFLDALRFGVPLVALQNDTLAFYFRKYGPLGFMRETLDELAVLMQQIHSGFYCDDIALIKLNIERARSDLCLEHLMVDVRAMLVGSA